MRQLLSGLLLLAILPACMPPKHLPTPSGLKHFAKGCYIKATYLNDEGRREYLKGEIIAVEHEKLYLLEKTYRTAPTVVAYSQEKFLQADVFVSTVVEDPKILSIWGGLLPITAITHGWFGVLTINGLIGAAFSGKGSYRVRYMERPDWGAMHKFARFPQGLPANLDLSSIQ